MRVQNVNSCSGQDIIPSQLSDATKVAHQQKRGNNHMQRMFRMQAAVLTAALLAIGVAQIGRAEDGGHGGGNGGGGNSGGSSVRLRATLHGPAIHRIRPEGNGDFRFDAPNRLRLKVEVENVNLPNGTVLMVSLQHAGMSTNIGTVILADSGDAELELNSQDGQQVPVVHRFDTVTVSNGGTTIAAGVFVSDN